MNLLIVLWIIWVMSEIVLSGFMRAKKTKNNYDKSSLKILWITISLSITIGIFLRKTEFFVTAEYYSIIYYSGIFLVCIGLLIRWIAILKLRSAFTVNVSVSDDQTLVQTGMYKYIRHPAYLGSLLSFLGLAIIFNNWLTLVIIFFPILISFLYRINIEEKVLSKAFGKKYEDYLRSSWKLLPKVF